MNPCSIRLVVRALLTVVIVCGFNHAPLAATSQWIGISGSDWGNPLNWITGGQFLLPGGGDDVSILASLSTTIELNGNRTVNSLSLLSTLPYTVTGSRLTLQSGDLTSAANIVGTHVIASDLTLASEATWDIGMLAPVRVTGSLSANGFEKTGAGTLTLRSEVDALGALHVASGTLIAEQGAHLDLHGADVFVAPAAGTTARMILDAAQIASADAFDVGNAGDGEVTLMNGSRINSTTVGIGSTFGGDGAVMITGSDSSLTTDFLSVGAGTGAGSGSLLVSAQGAVSAISLHIVRGTAVFDGSSADATALGSTGFSGSSSVFVEGGASLRLTNGARLRSYGTPQVHNDGEIFVEGAGTLWENIGHALSANTIRIGYAGGLSRLNVSDNAAVVSYGNLQLGSTYAPNPGVAEVLVSAGGVINVIANTSLYRPETKLTIDNGSLTTGEFQVFSSTVSVKNGGSLTSVETFLNELESLGPAMIGVDGAGSQWINTGYLGVGEFGPAHLDVTGGARVDTANIAVLNGTVVIDGGTVAASAAGSSGFGGFSSVFVGQPGILTIRNGGQLLSAYTPQVHNGGSVVVSGSGSQWLNTGGGSAAIRIGYAGGQSRLTVINSANVTSEGDLQLGSLFAPNPGVADMLVTSGATVNIAGTTTLMGNGTRLTLAGGALTTGSFNNLPGASLVHTGGRMTILGGAFENQTTNYFLNGPGDPELVLDGASMATFGTIIGTSAMGRLVLKNNAAAGSNFINLGLNATGKGVITVDQGELTTAGLLEVGQLGEGELRIGEHGSARSRDGSVATFAGSSGLVVVDGMTAEWINSQDLYLGGSASGAGGSADLRITNGGQVSVGGKTTVFQGSRLYLDGGTFTTGSIDNDGALDFRSGLLRIANSDLDLVAGGSIGALLVLTPGMQMEISAGALNVTSDAQVLVNGGGAGVSAHGGVNHGEISVIAGALAYTGPATNAAEGNLNAINAILDFGPGLDNLGTVSLINSEVAGNFVNNGVTNLAGTTTFTGAVSGAADFHGGSIVFEHAYSPGNSTAEVSVFGNVEFGVDNVLLMELLGEGVRGIDYDALNVAGELRLGGTLSIVLLNDFVPTSGAVFDLLDFAPSSLLGAFTALDLPELGGGRHWNTSRLYLDGSLSVATVPLPAAVWSFGGALIGLLGLRRRGKRKRGFERSVIQIPRQQGNNRAVSNSGCGTTNAPLLIMGV